MARRYPREGGSFYINPAELKAVHLIQSRGMSQKQVAQELKISIDTLKHNLGNLYSRVRETNNWPEKSVNETRAIMYLYKVGILPITEEEYNKL